jgi:hypothetical protein
MILILVDPLEHHIGVRPHRVYHNTHLRTII